MKLFPDRERTLEHGHIRSIEVQQLEALLRIEELLQKLVDPQTTTVEGDVSDRIYNISPQETPFTKAGAGALLTVTKSPAPKVKPKNPRQL